MTEGKRNIIHQLLEEYDVQTAEDIQEALKDLLGGTIKEMLEAEMDGHPGYEKSERSDSNDAKGMTTRQIFETVEDIYGFETSEGFICDVTDKIRPQIEDWQNRPLDEIYPILYIDAIHYSVRDNGVIRKLAAYVILGVNAEGNCHSISQNGIPALHRSSGQEYPEICSGERPETLCSRFKDALSGGR